MKQIITVLILALVTTLPALAQDRDHKFDPAKFDAEMEQFITTEAALTPQEAASFFPLFREMLKKQRMYFGQMRRFYHIDTNDEKACREAVLEHDRLDMEMKQLQQDYHQKFMRVLPPSKVYKVLRAENKFHRQMFKRAAKQ